MNRHIVSTSIIGLVCLALGVGLGYMLPDTLWNKEDILSIRQDGYTFINPLLECETKTYGNNQKYIPFEKDLIEKINERKEKNPNIELSVYFRNLRNGPWFGINEDADFSPASLMKLPILFMYMKWAEMDPSILTASIMPTIESMTVQSYMPEKPIEIGKGYTVSELLYHLIVYSDNVASNALIESLPTELQNRVFTELNIPLPKDTDYTLSVKEYASFFRMLYNASYLTRDYSEKSLGLLSQSTFTGGIKWKLPKNLIIAHKFGEREAPGKDGKILNQLHDCGIVYYTAYPYLVCIMTRWESEMDTLSELIQDTSKIIYDEVSTKYPE